MKVATSLVSVTIVASITKCTSFTQTRLRTHIIPRIGRQSTKSSETKPRDAAAAVPTVLRYKNKPDDDEDETLPAPKKTNAKSNPPTPPDVKYFLTQRSIQSFCKLLEECRDLHTVRWIESFCGCATSGVTVLQYHGLAAFNVTQFEMWDSVLSALMEQGEETVEVVLPQMSRRTANPFLQNQEKKIIIDIDPPSLASRILSVREQLANEWHDDLEILIKTSDIILTSYVENVIKERDDEVYSDDTDRPDAPEDTIGRTKTSFDRDALYMMVQNNIVKSQHVDNGGGNWGLSSPLRRSNFDLLSLLATQESIHRVLKALKDEGMTPQRDWLFDFYVSRREYFESNHFNEVPHKRFYRADDFIEEILLTPPSFVTKQIEQDYSNGDNDNNDEGPTIIDPFGLAEVILKTRNVVAEEWKNIVSGVPSDHVNLRKMRLARQMMITDDDDDTHIDDKENEDESELSSPSWEDSVFE